MEVTKKTTNFERIFSLLLIGTSSRYTSSEGQLWRRVQVSSWGNDGSRLQLRTDAWVVSIVLAALAITIAGLWIFQWDEGRRDHCGIGMRELSSCGQLDKIVVAILIAHFCAAPVLVVWSEIVGWLFTPMTISGATSHLTRYPRIMPAMTGVFERGLLTPLFVAFWGYNSLPAIGAVAITYVGIRTLRVDAGDGRAEHSSLHSIWNSSISVGFAIVAGWAYWQV